MKLYRNIVFMLFMVSFACAGVWNVPDSVLTIQAAIDTAASGDTVLVNSSHQNVGPVEIIGKKIMLISKGYLSNPDTYGISSGAALFDTLNNSPQLTISSADSTIVMGFLIDKSDIGNGGGVIVQHSDQVHIEGVYFRSNSLVADNATLYLNKTRFYDSAEADYDLISAANSNLTINNTVIKDSDVDHLIVIGNNTELNAENMAVYDNNCTSELFKIGSGTAYFNYITSYNNSIPGAAWSFSSTWTSIRNSILEFAPPLDIGQCEINYTAVPGDYPGTGNISLDPLLNLDGAYPALLASSPCISSADPDTAGIPRYDILGNARPNPEWAPPDMGAYESERHVLLNDDNLFWISEAGDDIWGNGSKLSPFASLQAAIDYATETDTIILLPGSYQTNALVEGKSLIIASEYLLNSDESYRDSVVLLPDTNIAKPIILLRDVDSVMVSGLSLKNGQGFEFYNNYSFGGAIYCENSMMELKYLKFTGNHSDYSGGALYALESDLYLNGVEFDNNTSYLGGAVSMSASNGYFAHVVIQNNLASSGGGVYLENESKLIAYYTDISGNIASNEELNNTFAKPALISQYGGGIYSISSILRLHNTLLSDNLAANQGAALAQRYGTFYLLQSTIADNVTSADSSGALYLNELSEDALIVNSILYDQNESEIILEDSDLLADHSFISGGEEAVINLTSGNTLDFISVLNGDPGLNADYDLIASSQCLNVGVSSFLLDDVYLFNYDESEYEGTAPHLGQTGANPDVPFLREPVISEIEILPETHELLKVYPNPFNPVSTLAFNLTQAGRTNLSIYNIAGKRVSVLANKYMSSGQYQLEFNALLLPSGIYIARLTQENMLLSTSKLLLVK